MEEIEFGPNHPVHQRITWAEYEWRNEYPIILPKSFIPHLARNEALSSVDFNRVKAFRAALAVENEREVMEIQELNDKLARLQERTLTRKKASFVCDVMLSPFRRLPLDILQEIADHCRPDQHAQWERSRHRNGHTPSKLAASCSTWHAVIYSMPSLWQNISIDCDRYVSNTKSMTALPLRIDHFARLARHLPLTIHCADGDDEGLRKCIMEWIFWHWEEGCRNRLQRLNIHPYKAINWLNAIHRIHEKAYTLPSVQTLIITDSRRHPDTRARIQMVSQDFDVICDLFPNLHRMWLGTQDVHFDFSPGIFRSLGDATVNDSFSNMTHMSIADSLNIDVWTSLLRVLPNLECGMFRLDATQRTSEFVHSFHVIPCLHHLALAFSNFSLTHVLEPFINLRFPKLGILYVQFVRTPPAEFDPQPEDDELSQDSFSNTFPALHTMQIHTYTRQDPDSCGSGFTGLFHLFLAAPALTTLAVYVSDTEDLLAIANFLREDQRCPLPNIQVFEMSFEDFNSTDELTEVITESLLGTLSLPSSSIEQTNPNIDIQDSQVPASRNHFISSGMSIQYRLGLLDAAAELQIRELQELEQRLREKHGLRIGIECDDSFLMDKLIWDLSGRKDTVEEWFISQF